MCFKPEFTEYPGFVFFDIVVDLIFMVDMMIMFMTSYQDKTGKEIKHSHTIAFHYMKSFRFFCDFMAILGTGFITMYVHEFKIFGIFKLSRVFRLSRMIASLNTHKDIKAMITLVKYTFYLFLLIHMMACAWYAIVVVHANEVDEFGVEMKWYPPFDWINYKDSKMFTDQVSLLEKYLICLYHGVLIVGFNELGPVNTFEIFAIFSMLLGSAIINA